jgi:transposase
MGYRPYCQDQMLLLPPSLEELIPEKDMVRVVNRFVDSLPRSVVESKFRYKRGRPPYHPRMMLKVVLYAYSQRLYSCRRIAKALRQNVCFMWLGAMERPDFNTVNRFRSDYLRECVEASFPCLVEMLLKDGYVRGEDYFVDGTKLEADASKYSHVWRKNVVRFKKAIQSRAAEILKEVEEINRQEDDEYGTRDLAEVGEASELGSEEIKAAAESVGQAIEKQVDPEKEKKLRKAAQELKKGASRLEEYERQEEVLGERNSYSKTDPDATFMRMKNGETRGSYNVQVGGENGFATGVSLSQNANDAVGLIDHMETREAMGIEKPKRVIADAGYGTEENYAYLEEKDVESYVKYPSWWREVRGKTKPFEKAAFRYDEENDRFICPMGRLLCKKEEETRQYKSGYKVLVITYQCESCEGCAARSECTSGTTHRLVQRRPNLDAYQQRVRDKLSTEQGQALRKRRAWECETIFADIKKNCGYTRVRLRGIKKALTDVMLVLLAHNLNRYRLLQATG